MFFNYCNTYYFCHILRVGGMNIHIKYTTKHKWKYMAGPVIEPRTIASLVRCFTAELSMQVDIHSSSSLINAYPVFNGVWVHPLGQCISCFYQQKFPINVLNPIKMLKSNVISLKLQQTKRYNLLQWYAISFFTYKYMFLDYFLKLELSFLWCGFCYCKYLWIIMNHNSNSDLN